MQAHETPPGPAAATLVPCISAPAADRQAAMQTSQASEAQQEPDVPQLAGQAAMVPADPAGGSITVSTAESPGSEPDAEECVICWEGAAEVILQPCGHLCLCEQCVQPLLKQGLGCPMCRVNIAGCIVPA